MYIATRSVFLPQHSLKASRQHPTDDYDDDADADDVWVEVSLFLPFSSSPLLYHSASWHPLTLPFPLPYQSTTSLLLWSILLTLFCIALPHHIPDLCSFPLLTNLIRPCYCNRFVHPSICMWSCCPYAYNLYFFFYLLQYIHDYLSRTSCYLKVSKFLSNSIDIHPPLYKGADPLSKTLSCEYFNLSMNLSISLTIWRLIR